MTRHSSSPVVTLPLKPPMDELTCLAWFSNPALTEDDRPDATLSSPPVTAANTPVTMFSAPKTTDPPLSLTFLKPPIIEDRSA